MRLVIFFIALYVLETCTCDARFLEELFKCSYFTLIVYFINFALIFTFICFILLTYADFSG